MLGCEGGMNSAGAVITGHISASAGGGGSRVGEDRDGCCDQSGCTNGGLCDGRMLGDRGGGYADRKRCPSRERAQQPGENGGRDLLPGGALPKDAPCLNTV